jgi:uncharacterized repeat protein (TIGR01451 family)
MSRTAFGVLFSAFFALVAGASSLAAQALADLSLTKEDAPDPVMAGSSLVYTITLTNEGPSDADSVTLSDPLPAGTTFQSLSQPAGWSCSTPAIGAGGTVSCSLATFTTGSSVFMLTVLVDSGVSVGTVLTNTATATSATPDPNPGAESATSATTVAGATTTFSITKTGAPDPVFAGANLTYTITASNNSGGDLESAALSDSLPAATTFVSLTVPAGWSCATPAVGTGGTVSCVVAPFPAGDTVFTLVVQVASSTAPLTVVGNQASLTLTDSGRSATRVASASTSVQSPATVSGTKTVGGLLIPGGSVTYTVVLTNGGPSTQTDAPGHEFTDVLPASLLLVGATATSGTTVATQATRTVTWDGAIPAGGSVTITITATIPANALPGSAITNQGTIAYDADGDGTNEASAVTDDPAVGGPADPTSFQVQGPATSPGIPTLDSLGLALLALLLAVVGVLILNRL